MKAGVAKAKRACPTLLQQRIRSSEDARPGEFPAARDPAIYSLARQESRLFLRKREIPCLRHVFDCLKDTCEEAAVSSDIELAKRQIVIRGQIGKMGKRRTIPINDTLHVILLDWPKRREGRLFPNYSSNQITMKFRRWARKIGLPRGISLHSLRATFACHLIAKGIDIYMVSRLLGHSSVKVTEKHYLALDPDHIRSAVNQLRFR